MNDPTRLRDGSDAHMRELLRYAQTQDRPSTARVDALTARVLAELAGPGASASTSTSDSAPAPAPAPASATGWLSAVPTRWIAGLAAALLMGMGAYRLIARPVERAAPLPAVAPQPPVLAPAVAPAAKPAAQPPSPAGARAPVAVAPEPAGQARREDVRPWRAKPSSTRARTVRSDPAAEVALLQRARRVVVADPRASLALVAQHHREFPQGVFAEEREALAVEALQRSGQRERAATRLQALLARYPRSSYRERLSALLADTRD